MAAGEERVIAVENLANSLCEGGHSHSQEILQRLDKLKQSWQDTNEYTQLRREVRRRDFGFTAAAAAAAVAVAAAAVAVAVAAAAVAVAAAAVAVAAAVLLVLSVADDLDSKNEQFGRLSFSVTLSILAVVILSMQQPNVFSPFFIPAFRHISVLTKE